MASAVAQRSSDRHPEVVEDPIPVGDESDPRRQEVLRVVGAVEQRKLAANDCSAHPMRASTRVRSATLANVALSA